MYRMFSFGVSISLTSLATCFQDCLVLVDIHPLYAKVIDWYFSHMATS